MLKSERPKFDFKKRRIAVEESIELQTETINNDLPGYHVTMGEGVMFKLSKSGNLNILTTHGLSGCVAMAFCIQYKESTYLFLNHTESDLLNHSTLQNLFENIKNTIKSYKDLEDFDFQDTKYNIYSFVIAAGFNSKNLAGKIVDKTLKELGSGRKCYVVTENSVCFKINYDCKPFFCVKLVVPKLVKDLTYYGPREKGYGTTTEKNNEPYKL